MEYFGSKSWQNFDHIYWHSISNKYVWCQQPSLSNELAHWAETKWTPFRRRHFHVNLLELDISILTKISLNFHAKGLINTIPALVEIMAWHQPGNKPLSEPMMIIILMHQWVKHCTYHIDCASLHILWSPDAEFITRSHWYDAVNSSLDAIQNLKIVNQLPWIKKWNQKHNR